MPRIFDIVSDTSRDGFTISTIFDSRKTGSSEKGNNSMFPNPNQICICRGLTLMDCRVEDSTSFSW